MSALIDLTGRKFGHLTVIKRGENDKYNKPQWLCQCDCGNLDLKLISGNSLTTGKTMSCGCLKRNKPKKNKIKQTSINELKAHNRIGEEKYNNAGDLMKIISYNSTQDISVEFQDKHKYVFEHAGYGNFVKGTIKNPYHPFLYNRGYLGVGDFKPTINKKSTKAYDAWLKIFLRAYKEEWHKIEPTYSECEVTEEWWDFQNFAKWFYDNYHEIPGYSIQVDKDWIVFGNKTYNPKYCELVPSIINTCILSHTKTHDENKNIPTGIQLTANGNFKPRISKYGKRIDYGTYKCLEDAMVVYMNAKIEYIKELADKFKPYISNRLYYTMYNFKERFLLENPEYEKIQ